MTAFHIREFRKSDFRRLWKIDQACFDPDIAYSQPELAYYMALPSAFTIVAEGAGSPDGNKTARANIVGFLVAQTPRIRGEVIGHIITIDILPEGRRSRLGSELMRIAEQRFAAAGCKRVSLEVAVNNVAAIGFYQRLGYSIARTIPRYYNAELDALEMEKQISPQRREGRREN